MGGATPRAWTLTGSAPCQRARLFSAEFGRYLPNVRSLHCSPVPLKALNGVERLLLVPIANGW